MDNIHIVVRQYEDEEKLAQIEREREEVQSNKDFQKWLKEMRIGSRCEVKNLNAIDMMKDYDFNIKESRMPEFIRRWF